MSTPRIKMLRAQLANALEDARADGGRLVCGLPPGFYRSIEGSEAWCGCLIGCAVGDVPYGPDSSADDSLSVVTEFDRRYGLDPKESAALEAGFEAGFCCEAYVAEFFELGAEFRAWAESYRGRWL